MSLVYDGRQLVANQAMQPCASSLWMLHIPLCQELSSLWKALASMRLVMMASLSTMVSTDDMQMS